MEGLFEREMDPEQTTKRSEGCDLVSFMSPNPECSKGVASSQGCPGRHAPGSVSYWIYFSGLSRRHFVLQSNPPIPPPVSVHRLTPELLYSGEVSSSLPWSSAVPPASASGSFLAQTLSRKSEIQLCRNYGKYRPNGGKLWFVSAPHFILPSTNFPCFIVHPAPEHPVPSRLQTVSRCVPSSSINILLCVGLWFMRPLSHSAEVQLQMRWRCRNFLLKIFRAFRKNLRRSLRRSPPFLSPSCHAFSPGHPL